MTSIGWQDNCRVLGLQYDVNILMPTTLSMTTHLNFELDVIAQRYLQHVLHALFECALQLFALATAQKEVVSALPDLFVEDDGAVVEGQFEFA